MTREEAISILKKLKLDAEEYGKESNFVKKAVEAFEMSIKTLDQESILDKIKQIVDRPIGNNAEEKAYNYIMIVKDIKEIIDKYKAESEE